MNGFMETAKREISRIKSSKFMLVVIFVLPLFFSFIIWWTFSAGTVKDLPVAVLDLDNSDITRGITRAIDSTPAADVKYKVENYNQGYDLIKGGQAYAFIVFPQHFKKDLNKTNRPKIVFYYNNQTILIGGILSKDIQSAVITSMKTVDAYIRMKKGLPKDAVMQKINLIRVDERVKSNPYMNYAYFLAYAAIAHIFQIFAVLFSVWTFGIEFKDGTTKEWLKIANDSIFNAVFGKLFVYLIIFSAQLLLTFICYIVLYGAPFRGNIIFCIFSTMLFILAYQLVGMMFVAITSNLRLSMSCGAFYTAMGLTFAGMTFPAMSMPAIGRLYSVFLPIRPYVNLFVDQAMKGFQVQYDLIYIYWITAVGLMGLSTIGLLKKHANDEGLWYQI